MPEKIKLTETTRTIELPNYQKNSLPWEKLPEESLLWYERFLVYRDLPEADRKVRTAYHEYVARSNNLRQTSTIYLKKEKPKSEESVHKLWYEAHDRFKWEERTVAYVEHFQRIARETKENEIRKIEKQIINQERAERKRISAKLIKRAESDLDTLDKPLKASEIANFFRIGAQDQDKVNELLYPTPSKTNRVAGQLNANAGHLSTSMESILRSMEDGRPKSVIEAEEKLRLENTTSQQNQQNQQSELVLVQEVDCYEEP